MTISTLGLMPSDLLMAIATERIKTAMELTKRYQERHAKTILHHPGRSIGFRCDQIKTVTGKPAYREFMVHPGAVGVLAFDEAGKVILVKQYRYPVGQFTLEVPAGKLDKGEDPLKCVNRELEEETGYRAKRVKKLVSYWPTAAFSTEVIHLYVATGLTMAQAHPDEDEFIELVKVWPKQLEQWMRSGKIQDSKTLIAYNAWKVLFK